jgi:tRNA G18 (ribose-2'-O)-methylase SpoU
MPLSTPLGESPETVRETLAPLRNDFAVALLAAGNAFAVGAVIRVAHSFLAREVILIGEGSYYPKASMGMEKYENVVRVADLAAFRSTVAGRPVWAVEKDYARRSVTGVERFPPGVVFLFGSERFGMPAEVAAAANEVVGIPIYGVNHSLPVTVAAGIVMHEWARRQYAEGATL